MLIRTKDLIKTFRDKTVIEHLNLEVEEGKLLAYIGTNGAGKSTTMKMLTGLLKPTSGEIELAADLKIGMVFQSYELFPHLTVIDNICLSPVKVQKRKKEEVRAEAMELLERVGLKEKADSYPRQLSGGQKQRVAIVRALCMHPEILLFDEVTAALDPEMVHEVLAVMLDLASQGRTMIIVTHEMQFAKAVADRILFIDEGRIMEDTTPEKFFTNPETDRAKKFLSVFQYES